MENGIEKEGLTAYPYSIKIEQTAKGLRVHAHVYGNNEEETISSAISTYEKTINQLKKDGNKIAPTNDQTSLDEFVGK